jgi:hypothetical protein
MRAMKSDLMGGDTFLKNQRPASPSRLPGLPR